MSYSLFNVQSNAPTQCLRPQGYCSNANIMSKEPMKILYSSSSKEDLDAVLVQGMTHLSFEELQKEQEELHGVSAIIQKEKEELDVLLKSFKSHLDRLKSGTAYECAESIDKGYVCNQNFQLMFIRSNRYEPKASAEQAIRFFEIKMQLFGKEKLAKDITLSDLDEDDKASLLKGSFQVLRNPDSSGRRILLEVPGLMSFKSVMNELRARFYVFMHLAKSANSIGNPGLVFLSYCVGEFRDKSNGAGFVEITRLGLACPIQWGGLHLACDDRTDAIIAKAGIAIMPARMKAKTKVHFGSHCECQYRLSTFGIAAESLPFAPSTNAMVLDNHLEWYNHCLKREQETAAGETARQNNEPQSNDVLFAGRIVNGDGNVHLRSMAVHNAQAYNNGTTKERRAIVNLMVENIKSKGGRFLKLDIDGSSWIEVSVQEVREKIVQMFRNFRRPRAGQQKLVQPASPPQRIVYTSYDADILFGRQQGHGGNQKLRRLVEKMSSEYDEATRGRKKQLVEGLIKTIQQSGGRFLKPMNDGRYEELSMEAAAAKIASHFRNYRRLQRGRNE